MVFTFWQSNQDRWVDDFFSLRLVLMVMSPWCIFDIVKKNLEEISSHSEVGRVQHTASTPNVATKINIELAVMVYPINGYKSTWKAKSFIKEVSAIWYLLWIWPLSIVTSTVEWYASEVGSEISKLFLKLTTFTLGKYKNRFSGNFLIP
jgi:hypothetical protein